MILGTIALWKHAWKSSHPLKNYLSKTDFSFYLAVEDGYIDSISRWWFLVMKCDFYFNIKNDMELYNPISAKYYETQPLL